ncbi:hypothetical protein ACFUVQ_00035 [Streptomyces rochei]|uniref:hypothetical protein n=1 Tax=Streptomyces rochei TaxID=1928 RepID=UPI00363E851F
MSSTGMTSGMSSGMTGGTSNVGGTTTGGTTTGGTTTGGTDGTQVSWKAVWQVVPALLGGAVALLVAFFVVCFVKEIHGLRRGRRKD